MSEAELCIAARKLLQLYWRYPDLFKHVLPINEQDLETLLEIAEYDDEEERDI